MTTRSLVQHPIEPREHRFDWWTWRVHVRLVAQQLGGLMAGTADPETAARLQRAREGLLGARLEDTDAAWLAEHVRVLHARTLVRGVDTGGIDPDGIDMRGLSAGGGDVGRGAAQGITWLLVRLGTVLGARGLTPARDDAWHLPQIVPDWRQLGVTSLEFRGTIDGYDVAARLPWDADGPMQALDWEWAPGGPLERWRLDGIGRVAGPYLDHAPALWDWLLARALTVSCLAGRMAWPAETQGPIALALPPSAREALQRASKRGPAARVAGAHAG